MKFVATSIPDVILIKPKVHDDARGFFMETYQLGVFTAAGISDVFIQDNYVGSRQGVLRGLHYQIRHAQGKLIRVTLGEVFDVCVDLRRSSPSFGRWMGVELSSEAKEQLWIPPGFAHGYYVLSDWAEVSYKVTNVYAPSWERTLIWNDPKLGIDWPLIDGKPPRLSSKDAEGLTLGEADLFD